MVGWIRILLASWGFLFFGVLIGNCSQDIEVSHNDSKYGGSFSEAVYNLKYQDHNFRSKYVNEKLGRKYNFDYKYSFDSYFGFAAYNNDSYFNNHTFDIGVGYGWYLLDMQMIREKVSIAAIMRGGKYITSIRLKTYIKAGIATFKNVIYYRPEVSEQTSDTDISFKLSKKTSLGYKNSMETIKGKQNFTNRLYAKVVF